MSSEVYLSSAPMAPIAGGNNAFGGWATLFTPAIPIKEIRLMANGTVGGLYGLFNLGVGNGSSPRIIIPSGLCDAAYNGQPLNIPLGMPAGASIQIQFLNQNGTTNAWSTSLVGVASNAIESCGAFQSLSGSNLISLGTAWTLIGTTMPLRMRKATIIFHAGNAFGSYCSINIGVGPSASAIQPLLSNLSFGSLAAYMGWFSDYDLDLPPSQSVWMQTSSTTPLPLAGFYAYY